MTLKSQDMDVLGCPTDISRRRVEFYEPLAVGGARATNKIEIA